MTMILPPQTSTTHRLVTLPSKDELCKTFVGQPISSLRSPAAIIDRSIFKANCLAMANKVKENNLRFRAHVKTHKTVEGIALQIEAGGKTDKAVVCSTMTECWQIAESRLITDGLVDDILFGMPIALDKIQDAQSLSDHLRPLKARFRLMVDCKTQIEALHQYAAEQTGTEKRTPWSVMIKLDAGYHRAGLATDSEELKQAIRLCLDSPHIELFGFYAHFGHSYNARSEDDAHLYLQGEVEATNGAAKMALEMDPEHSRTDRPYVLSFGATPTAHVSNTLTTDKMYGELELHAGNYCCLDLQQVATNLTGIKNVAVSVLSRVISAYPHRNEALCDTGGIAMSKDTGPWPGYGKVVSPENLKHWELGRISQEHGILIRQEDAADRNDLPEVGQVVRIVGQHACMILSNHPWYYVVEDGGDKVVDVWVPWKGW